jgi:hypothetical protein
VTPNYSIHNILSFAAQQYASTFSSPTSSTSSASSSSTTTVTHHAKPMKRKYYEDQLSQNFAANVAENNVDESYENCENNDGLITSKFPVK